MMPLTAPTAWARTIAALLCVALAPLATGQTHSHEADANSRAFQPDQALYSRIAGDDIPEDPGPGADEMAPSLGLVPDEPDHGIPTWRHEKTGMRFVFVPGGVFHMGSNHADLYQHVQVVDSSRAARLEPGYYDREQPMGEVYVSPFFIGMNEVTVAEYRPFLELAEADGVAEFEFPLFPNKIPHTPYLWNQPIPFWEDDQPITGITWMSAYAFCAWMGARLPTEAEWEKAARGTDARVFPWGNRFSVMRANITTSMNGRTLPVGMLAGGRSPYGCYNMAGNVMEYCLDAFEVTAFRYRRDKDHCLLERAPPEPRRVVRGGSWNESGLLYHARTTNRIGVRMDLPYEGSRMPLERLNLGFRVVLSPNVDLYPDGFLEQFRAR